VERLFGGAWEGNTFVVKSSVSTRARARSQRYPHSEEMQLEERYHKTDANTLEMDESSSIDVLLQALKSDHKIWKLVKDWDKLWDEQITAYFRRVQVQQPDPRRQRREAIAQRVGTSEQFVAKVYFLSVQSD